MTILEHDLGLNIRLAILLILITLILNAYPSSAKVGYLLDVDVNGTKWTWSQSTTVLSFQSDSAISGMGNCSKYANIAGFAGNGLKDNIYAMDGSFSNSNKISIKSVDKWIHIAQYVDNNSNRYYAEINESLPTIVSSKDELYYKGKGIYSNGKYSSGSDFISLNYQATSISKKVNFGGFYSDAIIRANITPGQIQLFDLTNRSMALAVSSMSDKLSEIEYDSDNVELEEAYRGFYRIDSKFIFKSHFNLDLLKGFELPCCLLPQTDPLNHSIDVETSSENSEQPRLLGPTMSHNS